MVLSQVVAGASAVEPQDGEQMKDAIHLYDVFMPAYTFDTTIEIKKSIIEDIQ
jgi:hypothetical protein